MTLFMLEDNYLEGHPLKSMVRVNVHENGQAIHALAIIPTNTEFPIQNLRALGANLASVLSGVTPGHRLDAAEQFVHFEHLNSGDWRLRGRDPAGGVSDENGVIIAVNKALPPFLQTLINERFSGGALRQTLDTVQMGPKPASLGASTLPDPAPAL